MTLADAHFLYRVLPDDATPEQVARREEAGAIMLREVQQMAWRFASYRPELVEETIPTVLYNLLKRPPPEPLPAADNVRAHIYVVFHNALISEWRRDRRWAPAPEAEPASESPVGTIDVDSARLKSRLADFAKALSGVSREAALELIAIDEGIMTFDDVLGELARRPESADVSIKTLRARKHQQYKRAKQALETAATSHTALGIWERSMLLYAIAGLGLSNA